MSLDDERVLFYLRHREQIEEWAALRAEAASAVDEWLGALRPAIEELAAKLGADVVLHTIDGGDTPYPSYRLVRRGWPESQSKDPAASITLEWIRGKTTLRTSTSPYVGLRCAKDRVLGAPLRESEAIRRVRARRKETTSSWWIAYAYVSPAGAFPEDAEAYRAQLIAALCATWNDYAHLVDAALG